MDQDQSVSPDAAIDEADGRPDDRDDVLAAILVEDDDPDETADSAGEAAIEEVEAIAEPEAAPDGAPPDEDLMSNLFEDAGDAEAATTEADDVVTDDAAALFDEPVAEPDTEEPAADEPAAEEPAADEEPEAVVPEPVEVTANPSSPTADHGLEQVESVLGEMKTALVELAQRPQPEPASLDVSPLVQAVSEGFERSSQQHERTVSAIDALAGQMGRVEQAVLHASAAGGAAPAVVAAPTVAAPVAEGMSRQTLALGAIAMVVLAWSVVFWVKTGSPRVALGTLVGANAVACCLLLAQRDRR